MIFDLGVHDISLIQELVPPALGWRDGHGHQFRREGREIEVMTCARARSCACILQNQDAETFAAIELCITERIYHEQSRQTFNRNFPALLVMGKGSSVDTDTETDLKALEIEFDDGTVIRVNLDTHAVTGGDIEGILRVKEVSVDKTHRGINAPLLRLLEHGLDVGAKTNSGLALFQSLDDAWENAYILAEAQRQAQDHLFPYKARIPCHDLVGRLIADGRLGSKWRIAQPLHNLIIGTLPTEAVP